MELSRIRSHASRRPGRFSGCAPQVAARLDAKRVRSTPLTRAARWIGGGLALIAGFAVLEAYQRPFRTYTPMEGADSEAGLPPDYKNQAEVVLGRLMYPSGGGGGRGFGRGGGNWLQ